MFKRFKETEEEKTSEVKDVSKMRELAAKSGMFNSKRGTFDYYHIFEGYSVEESKRLSELVIEARGITEVPQEAPKSFVEKAKIIIKQGSDIYNEYPKLGEFVVGLISGAATSLLGVAAGNKLTEKKTDEQVYELNNVEPIELTENAESLPHQD